MIKKKSNKTIYYLLVGIVLIIIILIVAKKAGWIGAKTDTEVEVQKAIRHTIIETVSASGKLQPETEVKISAVVSGQIVELPVIEGQKVHKGDLLCRIKSDEWQRGVERTQAGMNNIAANLAATKAGLSQSKASFEKVKLAYNRSKALYEKKVISQADMETATTEFAVAKGQLESSEENVKAAEYSLQSAAASVKEAQYSLSKTSIFAPMDGTVSKLGIELGESVLGTMQFNGTELMRIANLNVMEAEVEVNENDIVRLHLQDTATIEIDAFRGDKFKGIVTRIANSSASANDQVSMEKVTNFKVKIRMLEASYQHLLKNLPPNQASPFRPGMTVNVEIQTKRAINVVAVPNMAVAIRNGKLNKDSTTNINSGDEVVYIYKDGKAIEKKIKTGIQDDLFIEIKEGLKGDEEIICGPYKVVSKELNNGDKVKKGITKKDKG
ncbi:MAG: efflux RND transporter periplasmic adaptor subunit [Bacteroidetes bacterium]|nr:efflux RND transporter periplasmic adaptor subunit [Bacteroidota bacterium]